MTTNRAGRPPVTRTEPESHDLKGNLGYFHLVFTVVAYNAPMVVFLGFIPVAILLGNGTGTPVTFIVCGVIALLFAVGLVAMGLRIPRPGGFYTFVTAGLGKRLGLGTGFLAILAYYACNLSAYGLGGGATQSLVRDVLGGPDIPWWVFAMGYFVIVSILGYLNFDLSANLLVIFLALEVALMIIYIVAVFAQGGAGGIEFDSFRPENIFSGSLGIAFVFGVGIFGGFEATIIFRSEVKNPQKTIPRATYTVVIGLLVLYTVSSFTFINAYGADVVMSVLSDNVITASTESVRQYTGEAGYVAASIMLITSAFALMLASHGIAARYLFNLGVDGALPKFLGRAHPRYSSPHQASIVLSVAVLIALVTLISMNMSGDAAYAVLAGVFSYMFLILLVLASLAVTIFLFKDHSQPRRATRAAVCSGISFVFLSTALVLATGNFTVLTGATGWITPTVIAVIYLTILGGVVAASIYRTRRPETYQRIGRYEAVVTREIKTVDSDRA